MSHRYVIRTQSTSTVSNLHAFRNRCRLKRLAGSGRGGAVEGPGGRRLLRAAVLARCGMPQTPWPPPRPGPRSASPAGDSDSRRSPGRRVDGDCDPESLFVIEASRARQNGPKREGVVAVGLSFQLNFFVLIHCVPFFHCHRLSQYWMASSARKNKVHP